MEKIIEDQYAEEIKKITNAGYSDISLKEIEPNLNTDFHTHDFDAYACVVKGKFILHCNNKKHVLKPGNFFSCRRKTITF